MLACWFILRFQLFVSQFFNTWMSLSVETFGSFVFIRYHITSGCVICCAYSGSRPKGGTSGDYIYLECFRFIYSVLST